MTVFEMAVWLGGVLLTGVAAGRLRQLVPHFASLTMYRRDGGSITMPRPGVYRPATTSPLPLFDGVVVPSARGADALLRAASTARNAGATLVVLASGRTTAKAAELLFGTDRCIVLETPDTGGPPLRTFGHPCATTTTDISRKRNSALVLARRRGW